MIELRHDIDGEKITINVVETPDDLDGFRDFIRAHSNCLAVDTETTGLDIYSDTFRCRLVQFGTQDEAWVLPVDDSATQLQNEVRMALKHLKKIVMQNASYDLQVLDRCFGIEMEELWPKIMDTQIIAKLVDPRPYEAGGFGHSLEALVAAFVSEELASEVKGLMTRLAQEHKTTKAKIWSEIDLFHPEYLLYAGMDTVFTSRVCSKLVKLLPDVSRGLVKYEHKISEICSYIDRRGFLMDVEYAQELSDKWAAEQEVWEAIAFTDYGVDKVNSTEDVAEALEEMGILTGRTETGKRKVDKELLSRLIEDGNELAEIVFEAKKLGKWRSTWVQKFLDSADSEDRCHTFINPLQARTSRMSITGIPAQTLPASDSMVRRCFVADPGHVIASVDYQTQELRVLAALSGDQTMIGAFENGLDLHQITADASQVTRKVGKMANFLTVYGGGPKTLAEQAHIDFPTARRVLGGFAKTYPGVAAYSKKLAAEAGRCGYIVTPMGRKLPVDSSRAYSALNYMIQSSSRDVTCRALIRLHEAGFTPYLRLPIHDEIVASLPAAKAQRGAAEIGRLMAEQMGPVLIGTDPEVGKRSWGSLYGADY